MVIPPKIEFILLHTDRVIPLIHKNRHSNHAPKQQGAQYRPQKQGQEKSPDTAKFCSPQQTPNAVCQHRRQREQQKQIHDRLSFLTARLAPSRVQALSAPHLLFLCLVKEKEDAPLAVEKKKKALGVRIDSPSGLTGITLAAVHSACRFALLPPSRHDDSRVLRTRQSSRFLETASLHPPQAALRLFPLSAAAAMRFAKSHEMSAKSRYL
ncbi:MAG: hypothetical protein IKB53_02040 [Oscillospiraceae bacterium]|nr:hypothetical protein [Oscillospiraceae bacterium]